MKENKYDDEVFFNKYKEMSRSVYGLKGAGEWPSLVKILPDFQGKDVLDLGCGYGWHCRYAAQHGASRVLGTDISRRMLETARSMDAGEEIEYQLGAMEDLQFADGSFDIVFSSLAFHYVKDIRPLFRNIRHWLRDKGVFVFSAEHPVFTAYGSQDWYYDDQGNILHFPVDNYYYEGKREAVFLGEKVIKYHRTLTTYLETLLENGFSIRHVVEPPPPEDMMDLPGMRDEMRRPMMLLVCAEKRGDCLR
ncbi:MAG TPA: class I SAM-dependent methyltransferase [Candidatus Enterocloster excrementipullorum]|uniref:Class I SAM-dependent methyltransferase n=1 Tax=Candidatus Enterocloster excrementipullorum TaxID=2838559 RepID=A0A9D2SH70_9FIRM|nr:class I SAM-dependent methyltransferase [Candidatus Enterocloster excrementipullorum]